MCKNLKYAYQIYALKISFLIRIITLEQEYLSNDFVDPNSSGEKDDRLSYRYKVPGSGEFEFIPTSFLGYLPCS